MEKFSDISWKLMDKYFKDNTHNLVAHHLDSYNDFFAGGINRIFQENNPIRFIEREDEQKKSAGVPFHINFCSFYCIYIYIYTCMHSLYSLM